MKIWLERGGWISKRARNIILNLNREHIKKIVIIRHAALGDMVLLRPFLIEVRHFFPNAEITLSIVSHYHYGVPNELFEHLHIINGIDKKRYSILDWIGERRKLKHVDILFDLADTSRSRLLTFFTKAKLKIGFPYKYYLRPLLFDAAVFRSDYSFEAINMLDMLMLFGANPAIPLNFGWQVQSSSVANNRIVYFPFASIAEKCWDQENFLSLIDRMASTYPSHEHVVLGGVSEREVLDAFVDLRERYENITLQPAMNLDALTVFLQKSSLLIANDTGVRNLAIALSTPTVGIFFSTVPYRYWPRYGGHEAVFKPNGEQPNVRAVLNAAMKVLGSSS